MATAYREFYEARGGTPVPGGCHRAAEPVASAIRHKTDDGGERWEPAAQPEPESSFAKGLTGPRRTVRPQRKMPNDSLEALELATAAQAGARCGSTVSRAYVVESAPQGCTLCVHL